MGRPTNGQLAVRDLDRRLPPSAARVRAAVSPGWCGSITKRRPPSGKPRHPKLGFPRSKLTVSTFSGEPQPTTLNEADSIRISDQDFVFEIHHGDEKQDD